MYFWSGLRYFRETATLSLFMIKSEVFVIVYWSISFGRGSGKGVAKLLPWIRICCHPHQDAARQVRWIDV